MPCGLYDVIILYLVLQDCNDCVPGSYVRAIAYNYFRQISLKVNYRTLHISEYFFTRNIGLQPHTDNQQSKQQFP